MPRAGLEFRRACPANRAVVRGRASGEYSRDGGVLACEARRAQYDFRVPEYRVSVRDHRGCDCAGAVAADGDSELSAAEDAGRDRACELKLCDGVTGVSPVHFGVAGRGRPALH